MSVPAEVVRALRERLQFLRARALTHPELRLTVAIEALEALLRQLESSDAPSGA